MHRAAAVNPIRYAKTRNFLDGGVTGLSPYLTHGLVTLPEVLRLVLQRESLGIDHKLVYEFGWREFYRHVWTHAGNGIFRSLHEGPLDETVYKKELPHDVRHADTGIPVIDEAIRTLYDTGTLHNHARMWLASYLVHIRKVHWRVGADWLVAHLLDGDLASNHLSWQWVAGTGSHKPYLFNAENVARYAPAQWHSPQSVIDKSYDELDDIARSAKSYDGLVKKSSYDKEQGSDEPAVSSTPPSDLTWCKPGAADLELITGRDVWLVHPWALRQPPADLSANTLVLGVYLQDHHDEWPWSDTRWRWVDAAMSAVAPHRWLLSVDDLTVALKKATRVRSIDDHHVHDLLDKLAELEPMPSLFAPVARRCSSFTTWWKQATRGLTQAEELLKNI
ncbi:MAG: deoxyribodipyrimidine photolyase [Oxalobacteraceae bacterium]|nr:deoxyribodipyrimidine photolyase [Oxalobacteraceae bacterium]